MLTLSFEQIEQAAQQKSVKTSWGWEEYRKVDGEWILDHLLIPEPDFKRSWKVYTDGRETELIMWAQ